MSSHVSEIYNRARDCAIAAETQAVRSTDEKDIQEAQVIALAGIAHGLAAIAAAIDEKNA